MSAEEKRIRKTIVRQEKQLVKQYSQKTAMALIKNFLKVGELHRAEDIARYGTDMQPDSAVRHGTRARILADRGETGKEFIDILTGVLKKHPDNLAAQKLLAEFRETPEDSEISKPAGLEKKESPAADVAPTDRERRQSHFIARRNRVRRLNPGPIHKKSGVA